MSIQVVRTPQDLRKAVQAWRDEDYSVGFVPTMGALHEGHLSLVGHALEMADRCVVSIFVNPTQFAPHEDFDSYPRDEAGDIAKLEKAGAHLVYIPSEKDIYPEGTIGDALPGAMARGLETDYRPHFFEGVVNVVSRLFDQVQPDWAVFGQKDFQQLMVIREMVEAYRMPVKIFGAPIVRDSKGLALSSRNAYLSSEDLGIARKLNEILFSLAAEIREYPTEAYDLIPAAIQALYEIGFDDVDYLELWQGRLLVAAWIGKTRLIDNVAV